MKLDVVGNELILSGLTVKENTTDISFCNIAGKDTGSMYYNPNRPEHSLRIVVSDPSIAEGLTAAGVPMKEFVDSNNPDISKYSFKIKLYPRLGENKATGEQEQLPKILFKDPSTPSERLEYVSFNLVDYAVFLRYVESMDIAFHVFENNFGSLTAALDEMKVTVTDLDTLMAKYQERNSQRRGYLGD